MRCFVPLERFGEGQKLRKGTCRAHGQGSEVTPFNSPATFDEGRGSRATQIKAMIWLGGADSGGSEKLKSSQ